MVRISKIISILLCSAVLLGTTGCSTCSTGTHPIKDGISCGATIGAAPGAIMAIALSPFYSDDEDDDDDDVNEIATGLSLMTLAVLGGGALIGGAIGAIVGTIDWLIPDSHPHHPKYDENYDPNKHP